VDTSEPHLSVAQDEISYQAQRPCSPNEQQPEATCLASRLRVSIDPNMGCQGQNEDGEKTEPDETRAEKVEGVAIHVLSHLQSCAGPKSLR